MSTVTAPAAAPQQNPGPAKGVRARLKQYGRPPRIMGLDVARGLALLGMVIAHVGEMPDLVWSEPSSWGGLVHGRSSILFALLAGISIALVTGRSRGLAPEDVTTARLRLMGRGGAIFLIGLMLELFGTPVAVILTFYGVLFIAAIPFLRWSARRLFIVATAIALVGPVLLALVLVLSANGFGAGVSLVLSGTYPVTVWLAVLLAGMGLGRIGLERTRAAITLLVAGTLLAAVGYGSAALLGSSDDGEWENPKDSWVDEEYVDDTRYGVPGSELDLGEHVCDVYEDDWVNCYPAEYKDEMYVGKGVDDSMSGSVYGDSKWEIDFEGESYFDMLSDAEIPTVMRDAVLADHPHSGGTAEILGSGGFAIAVVGLCLLLARPLRWAMIPIAALGSMPLTIYSGHLVVILIAMGGPTGTLEPGSLPWPWFCLGLVVFATVWSLLWGRGPLERLVGRAANAMTRVRHDREGGTAFE